MDVVFWPFLQQNLGLFKFISKPHSLNEVFFFSSLGIQSHSLLRHPPAPMVERDFPSHSPHLVRRILPLWSLDHVLSSADYCESQDAGKVYSERHVHSTDVQTHPYHSDFCSLLFTNALFSAPSNPPSPQSLELSPTGAQNLGRVLHSDVRGLLSRLSPRSTALWKVW